MAVVLKSYNEVLGSLVRKMVADSSVNDLANGSVLLTLLEAVASNDFDNSTSILSVLETLNIDAIRNTDLDARAADYGLSRLASSRATGFVSMSDSTITKRATTLYAVKAPPIAGSTVLYVNSAAGWAATGTLYIGRGTQQFEGPVAYTSIVNNGSFYTINLASALQKDHLSSDSVIDAQGTTDRLISAGTVVQIPANNQSAEVKFQVLRDSVLASGEDTVSNIAIVAQQAGVRSNAGINTIVSFSSSPFTGATVTNTSALTDGRDSESDDDLRERIKSYSATLARGTRAAILAAILNVSDSTDGKQVASAVITEPATIGDPAIVYIDDGSGFQPSYQGQPLDTILSSATGNEEFLQLANFPLPRPQVINVAEGPYQLSNGMKLRVTVGIVEEEVTFSSSQFLNIAASSLPEIVVAINDQAVNFRARLTQNSSRLLLSTVSNKAETIQVMPIRSTETESVYANSILRFPTNEYSYIKLYQNNKLLKSTQRSATVTTLVYSSWNIAVAGNLIVQVDGTPAQDVSFTTLDFDGRAFTSLSISDWVAAFNAKYAGVTSVATSSGAITMTSNRDGSSSSVSILGGSYLTQTFGSNEVVAVGQNSDFALNRQTGNLQIKTTIATGDSITAGSADTKGSFVTAASGTGTYNLSTDGQARVSNLVIVTDGSADVRQGVSFASGNTLAVSDQGSGVMRVLGNTLSSFAAAQLGDYLWITNRGDVLGTGAWVAQSNCGLYKILRKGDHLIAGSDTWIEVFNQSIVAGGPYTVLDVNDVIVFESTTYPQIWQAGLLPSPAAASLQSVSDSFVSQIANVKSSIYKTSSVKATSSTENDGSIAMPVSVGRAATIFPRTLVEQLGNPSGTAAKVSERDLIGSFNRGSLSGAFLDRNAYPEARGTLDASVAPGIVGVDQYSELLSVDSATLNTGIVALDDVVLMSKANNAKHFRSIKEFQAGNDIGTQHELPRTVMDHAAGDELNTLRPMSIAADDSAVFVVDRDAVGKTINVNFWRTGKVNTQYVASTTAFSADDSDNEPGVTFSSPAVWSKTLTGAEFKDYGVLFRARNWYRTGGAANSAGATMLLRAKEYGRAGERIRFKLEHPALPDQSVTITHSNLPDYSTVVCTLGSGNARSTGITSGTTFKVTNPSGNIFRYTFQQSYVDFTNLVNNDLVSILSSSGVSAANSGVFSLLAFNTPGKWIEVYNPSGTITNVGQVEISQFTAIADVVGTAAQHTITTTAQGATGTTVGSTEYFSLYDDVGMVVFWYDIDNAGAAAPTVIGASRYVEISTVATGDTATNVATKTAAVIGSDSKFSATALTNVVTATNTFNGPVTAGAAGPNTGFVVTQSVAGVANTSLGGKYFLIGDTAGSVAVWFNVYSESEPPHGAARSIQVIVTPGDSATTVANKIALAVNADSQFAASNALAVGAITGSFSGNTNNITAGTSGFAVTTTQQGIDDGVETISIASLVRFYPLAENDCQTVCDAISISALMTAIPVGSTSALFLKATREESYSYSGNSSALAYDHDPVPANNKNAYVSLWDGYSFVKTFANVNPQFILKKDLVLPGVVPSIYNMANCANPSSTEVGEFFKLVPKTVNNIKHHMSHKALSQLPLVANVDIVDNFRRIQVKSKKLGTDGAIEMVGGRANAAAFALIGDAQVATQSGVNYAELRVSAYPSSISVGDYIKIKNTLPAKRKSRLLASDKVDVVNVASNTFEYRLKAKETNSGSYVPWSITDVSASYSLPSNSIWRWTHAEAGAILNIVGNAVGSVLTAPADYTSNSTPDASALHEINYVNGTVSTAVSFGLTLDQYPNNGDFFRFQTQGGSPVSFAVWFDTLGTNVLPTGTAFTTATYKIRVDVSGTATASGTVALAQTVLAANSNFTANFTSVQSSSMSLTNVRAGDLLAARPLAGFSVNGFLDRWSTGNQVNSSGDSKVSGLPIIAVNATSRYVDVVNPNGKAMTSEFPGTDGVVDFLPAISLKWNLGHRSRIKITSVTVTSGVATVITSGEHRLNMGDSVTIEGVGATVDGVRAVGDTLSPISFTFVLAIADSSFLGGVLTKGLNTDQTKYSVEKLGANGLTRYRWISGPSPRFKDLGVAVDDFLVISGSSFLPQNTGKYRIVAVDNASVLVKNDNATEQKNSVAPFNEEGLGVIWTAAGTSIAGTRAALRRVAVGSWIKKVEDPDSYYVQVAAVIGGSNPSDSVTVTLGQPYPGLSSLSAQGVYLDQDTGSGTGVPLRSVDDLQVFEGDAAFAGDSLVVENIVNTSWFNTSNAGVKDTLAIGSASDHTQFIRVTNASGIVESNRLLSISLDGFYILESKDSLYETLRLVRHTAISQSNSSQRVVYVQPEDRVYKISDLYQSQISVEGKLGVDVSVTTGVDGYSYYIGLMRTVQRIVDGFEPDATNYPGRRAVGSAIETLPPLIRAVSMSLNVTTREGVNLTDITNDIKSAIIGYVNSLSVGGDVILSEIIARIMSISGVAAVTFTSPAPSTERIAVADDAKAYIAPESISIS